MEPATPIGSAGLEELGQSVAQLRRRTAVLAWSREGLRQLGPYLFALGGIVLALRFGLGWTRGAALGACWILVLWPLTTSLRTRGRALSAEGAAAWLDVFRGGRGLLLTSFGVRDRAWSGRVQAELGAARSQLKLRWRRPLLATLPAWAFVVGAWLVPLPEVEPAPWHQAASSSVERVREKLETLEEELELEEELAQNWRARLERLDEDQLATNPEATYEALDHLEEQLEQRAEEALQDARAANEGLAGAADPQRSGEQAQAELEEALEALSESGLAAELPESLEALAPGSLKLPPGMELSAEQIAALSEDLSEMLAGTLDALGDVGLLPAGSGDELGEIAELADFELADETCEEDCDGGPG